MYSSEIIVKTDNLEHYYYADLSMKKKWETRLNFLLIDLSLVW